MANRHRTFNADEMRLLRVLLTNAEIGQLHNPPVDESTIRRRVQRIAAENSSNFRDRVAAALDERLEDIE